MKILLVEDSADHRELISLALSGYEPTWQVEHVVSGEEALCRLAEGRAYDLVILDYSLPKRQGLDVLEEIKPGSAPPPVVMVTGQGDEQVAVDAMKAGAYDYVVKSPGYLQRLPLVAQRAMELHHVHLERERAEKSLRTNIRLNQTLLDAFSCVAFLLRPDSREIVASNKAAVEAGAVPGKQCYSTWGQRDDPCPWCLAPKVWATGQEQQLEVEALGIVWDAHWIPVSPDLYMHYAFDITERKRAVDQIRAALKEKEVLLREIHHRVKNNMQVISALLHLQSEEIEEDKYSKMFQETQDRIRSMALIHERLYKSKDLSNIDFAGYVQSLLYNLYQSHNIDPRKVVLSINVGETSIGLDRAIPCGLIINELVSNSLKHAFPEQREGEIGVAFRPINENEVALVVRDNGVGLPEDFHFQTTDSLGLRLVAILARDQLKGKIELNITDGTTFRIVFGNE